ncbi:MAG TPA: 50S ribosomal protein L6 [Balneolales bacterium]|nr:50S ribosomal protein L6 [Balneolales bacterium]
MSRIGKLPVPLKDNVEFSVNSDNVVTIKGAKGSLSLKIHPDIKVEEKDNEIVLTRKSENKNHKALHGLSRSLINNAVIGVTDGYSKTLEIIGVGYRASVNGGVLELGLGYSHPYFFVPPPGIDIEVDTKSAKNPRIIVSGIDKELVGQVTAKIRSLRPPEPYKGKGVRYLNEQIRRKAGKSAGR